MLRGLAGAHDVAPKSTAYQTIDLRSAAAEDCATQGVIWNRSNQQLLVPTAFGVCWTVNLAALRTRLAR
jgi:uncharacterized membrane protein